MSSSIPSISTSSRKKATQRPNSLPEGRISFFSLSSRVRTGRNPGDVIINPINFFISNCLSFPGRWGSTQPQKCAASRSLRQTKNKPLEQTSKQEHHADESTVLNRGLTSEVGEKLEPASLEEFTAAPAAGFDLLRFPLDSTKAHPGEPPLAHPTAAGGSVLFCTVGLPGIREKEVGV